MIKIRLLPSQEKPSQENAQLFIFLLVNNQNQKEEPFILIFQFFQATSLKLLIKLLSC